MAYAFTFTDTLSAYNTLTGARERWTSVAGANGGTVGTTNIGGTGSNGIGFAAVSPLTWLKTIALSNGWIVNVHASFTGLNGNSEIVRLVDQNGHLVIALTRLNTGNLQLTSTAADGFTTVSTTTGPVGGGPLFKIDLGLFYASSGNNARVEVRVNGTRQNEITSSAFSGGAVGVFQFDSALVLAPTTVIVANTSNNNMTLDAIGVQHDSALWSDPFTGFVGSKAKYALFADGEGTYAPGSNWTPQSAPTVHEAIDETPGDQDATYISSNTLSGGGSVLDRCSWSMSALPSNATNISHVCHSIQVRAAPPLTNATLNGFLDNGTIADGAANALPTDGSYISKQDNYMLAPGSLAWTLARVNAIQAGVRLTALS